MADKTIRTVRPAEFAGSWYPGSPMELGSMVDRFVRAAGPPEVRGDLIALISPHAGYAYSGPIAAYAYKELKGREFDVVAVIAPMHRTYSATLTTTSADAYWTPLGDIPVARDILECVTRQLPLRHVQRDGEHSLELQLPFLQRMLGSFELVPLMMPDQSLPACRTLASTMSECLKGRRALLVASSDLSHFHRQADALRLDQVLLDKVSAFDPLGLFEALDAGETEACGGGPVITVMLAAKALGANRASVLKHSTSAETTGDLTQVVGYAAAALFREE